MASEPRQDWLAWMQCRGQDVGSQSLWKMTRLVMRIPNSSSTLVTPGGLALSDAEKVEALSDSLEAPILQVNES